jgi:Tfp pilus assembly protein FimV
MCALALCACGLATAHAQPPAVPDQAWQQHTTDLSDSDMKKFAEIYVDIESARIRLADELDAMEEPIEPEDAHVRLQEQLAATIEGHGWSVNQYNRVAMAINDDPEKRDRAVELINQIVRG